MAYVSASPQAANELELRAILNRTSGGDNDTELNELTVVPRRAPSRVIVVTTATPVGNRPSASRKLRGANVICAGPPGQDRPGEPYRYRLRRCPPGRPSRPVDRRQRQCGVNHAGRTLVIVEPVDALLHHERGAAIELFVL